MLTDIDISIKNRKEMLILYQQFLCNKYKYSLIIKKRLKGNIIDSY